MQSPVFLEKLLIASYAEIESKYHGDGPKNANVIFQVAEREQTLLFIDEADSLLSKRLTNVTQGSEQAINSMRSQLLINLELFRSVVVFSTNLVRNYNKVFEARICLQNCLSQMMSHVKGLPRKLKMFAGAILKNAVIQSAIKAALESTTIFHGHLCEAPGKNRNMFHDWLWCPVFWDLHRNIWEQSV